MSRRQTKPRITRKHLARAEKERRERRWILLGAAATTILVVGILAYGWVQISFIEPRKPIITINGEEVSVTQFQGRMRLQQVDLRDQFLYWQQIALSYGDESQVPPALQEQMIQLETLLQNPEYLGQRVLDDLTAETLIRQEAIRRGLSVSDDEVETEVAHEFGYYPEGTPTPIPFDTLAPTKKPTLKPGVTPTFGPRQTAAPTRTPRPAATPYTYQAFLENYDTRLKYLADSGVSEADYLERTKALILRSKLQNSFKSDVPGEVDQVWLEHIVVKTEDEAQELVGRLAHGEDWGGIASQIWQESSLANAGRDIGWQTAGYLEQMFSKEFQTAAFETPIGEIGGPIETSSGWHLFLVKGHEIRQLEPYQLAQAISVAFQDWLAEQQSSAEISRAENWLEYVTQIAVP